jgi:hypothetical protein
LDAVTSLLVEHLQPPAGGRSQRALRTAAERAGDVLAERNLWLAVATPQARKPAERMRDHLQDALPGGSARLLQLAGSALREFAERLERIDAVQPALCKEDRDACERAKGTGDELLDGRVAPRDVVIVHDALGAVAIDAVRARGAHVVWRVCVGAQSPARGGAPDLIRRLGRGVDAYLLSWREGASSSAPVESVGAVLPAAGLLMATEFVAHLGEQPRRLAWQMAVAEIARGDRGERVGGRLHPRPLVAAH